MKEAFYCPECKAVYLSARYMPKMQVMVKPGNPHANKIIYKGVIMKLCPLHEGKRAVGTISGLDELQDHDGVKCCVEGLEEAANQILLKFQGVRESVLGGKTKNPIEFIQLLKSYFFAKSELEALEW